MNKLFMTTYYLLFTISLFLASPVYAAPEKWNNRCVQYGDVATIHGFECIFYNILQVIVILAGLAFFYMFISGGFKYLTSGGNEKSVASASSTITMAIFGLIGIIASWLILKFIQDFTGVNVTIFRIPG